MTALFLFLLLLLVATTVTAAAVATAELRESQRDMISLLQHEIARSGKPLHVEQHFAVTEDGYMLGCFRLHQVKSTAKPQPVALLMHGLLDSSIVWINNGWERSLAFALAAEGYDVWLGNNRGNAWSKRHTTLSSSASSFWDFSFDEMAQYDLPAMFDLALKHSASQSKQLLYVGHSQGSTQLFAALSTARGREQLLPRLAHFIGLAPAVFEFHMRSRVMKAMAEMEADKLAELIGMHEFAPSSKLMSTLLPEACRMTATTCENMLDMVYGRSDHLNVDREDVFLSQFPSGTSARNVQHWAQHTRHAGEFARFDFGRKRNVDLYGQPTAPAYDLGSFPMDLPCTLYFGEKDSLQAPEDRELLIKALPPASSSKIEYVVVPEYSHVDFVWGKDTDTFFLPHVMTSVLQKKPVAAAAVVRLRGGETS